LGFLADKNSFLPSVYCSDPPVGISSAGDAGDTAFAEHLRYPEERS